MAFIDDYAFSVLALYRKNLQQIFSISDIARLTGKKYAFVHRKVNELVSLGVLRGVTIGRSFLCSLALDEPICQAAFSMVYTREQPEWCRHFFGSLRQTSQQSGGMAVVYDGKTTVYVASIFDGKPQSLQESLQQMFSNEEKFSKMRVVYLLMDELMKLFLDDVVLYENFHICYNMTLFFEYINKYRVEFDRKYSPLYRGGDK